MVKPEDYLDDQSIAALAGLMVLVSENQEVRIPAALVEEGLPADGRLRVQFDAEADELVIDIVGRPGREL